MNLIFRADANTQMGNGHVMRCLALAQACQNNGGQATFMMGMTAPSLETRLLSEGMNVRHLSAIPGSRDDALQTSHLAKELQAKWVVVDGYHFGAAYQRFIKESGLQLVFVDDFGQPGRYGADLVLNQNLHAEETLYQDREPYTRLLLGTRYVLLRREFWPWRDRQRRIAPDARKVLVTLGGGDPDNVTLKVLEALGQVQLEGLEVRAVVGASNPHYQDLQSAARQLPYSLRLEQNVTNMPELMAWADLAITAGGSTCWELAFMGLPGLIIILADNQRPVGQWLDQSGIGVNLGWYAAVTARQISQAALRLLASAEIREAMALKGRMIVDGEGVARVLMLVRGGKLRLRPVRDDDCSLLWRWANDAEVRQAAFSTAAISWEDHQHWFSHKRRDPGCLQFIAMDDQDQPVGQVRFDMKEGETAEIDVSLDKSKRGLGYGKLILDLAAEGLFQTTTVKNVHSFIKNTNIRSIKAFEKAGYKRIGPLIMHGESSVHYVRERGDARDAI